MLLEQSHNILPVLQPFTKFWHCTLGRVDDTKVTRFVAIQHFEGSFIQSRMWGSIVPELCQV
jgi:hypothetical protein